MPKYMITAKCGTKTFTLTVTGRDEWALKNLASAGKVGLTPITRPAPRWSAYVHNLRNLGVDIETIHEPHGGEFAGTHARYVLHDSVREIGGTE